MIFIENWWVFWSIWVYNVTRCDDKSILVRFFFLVKQSMRLVGSNGRSMWFCMRKMRHYVKLYRFIGMELIHDLMNNHWKITSPLPLSLPNVHPHQNKNMERAALFSVLVWILNFSFIWFFFLPFYFTVGFFYSCVFIPMWFLAHLQLL